MADYINEIPKYKKRKDNSSKSNKRSSHKHEYETILLDYGFLGFSWVYRCKICGRLKFLNYSAANKGLRKTSDNKTIGKNTYFSLEELHEKYPDTRIFRRPHDENNRIIFDDKKIEEIKFDS